MASRSRPMPAPAPAPAPSVTAPAASMAVGLFDALFDLAIEHEFFGNRPCRGLSLTPTADSSSLLRQSGCLLRNTDHGLVVFNDRTRRQALRARVDAAAPPFVLTFIARSTDPWLARYTQGMVRDEATLLRFDSRRAAAPDADGRCRLHCGEFATASDRAPLAAPLFTHALGRTGRLLPPAFVVRIALRRGTIVALDEAAPAPAPRRYLIRLQTTTTRWKYYLPGDWAEQQPHVVDLAGQAAFEPARSETLGDGRAALTIRSLADIPLHDQPVQRFQLRARSALADRVLVKRLPVASAGQISAETIAGVRTLVSEIYVNR